jgi:uncharacterized protein
LILLDTGGLFAALNPDQREHTAARAALELEAPPYVLSPFVLAELDYLTVTRGGTDPELALIGQVSSSAYELAPFDAADVARAAAVIEQYRDLRIGIADASIVVLADRYGTDRVLTLDERHFRSVRPLQGGYFRLLPADA